MTRLLIGSAGLVLIGLILWDAFETVVLPRRVTRRLRLTSLYFEGLWGVWSLAAGLLRNRRRRDSFLSLFGPFSLILLLGTWATGLVVGFALMYVGTGLPSAPDTPPLSGPGAIFGAALYFSGSTLFTLGLGDVTPTSTAARALTVIEAFTGFAFLALVIGYLPIIYQAFSRREVHIVMLDEWAGSPPSAGELLRRLGRWSDLRVLDDFLARWEQWAADLIESHISYPVLAGFRSQHGNESWVAALTMVLDSCALVLTGIDGVRPRQAWLTFAMARHVAVDLCQVLDTPPHTPADRLPRPELDRLRAILHESGVILASGDDAERRLTQLRRSYEPYVAALADGLLLTLPPWLPVDGAKDNWQKTAWE
ncbi:MAG TPA: potassium channel family protein [Anaerolineales bacterium]|nr:potassium channel family protein [Anaerolineales bacterium]